MSWEIVVPPKASAAAGKGKVVAVTTPQANLLVTNSPTMMERWELSRIYCPIRAIFAAGAAKVTLKVIVTMNLRAGGDIVWSQQQHAEFPPIEGLERGQIDLLFAENFVAPVVFRRGRTLTLEVTIATEQQQATETELEIVLSSPPAAVVLPGSKAGIEATSGEGRVIYDAIPESGHRTL